MSKEKLINQHILEYEARLHHIDELIVRAHEVGEASAQPVAARATVADFVQAKKRLADEYDQFKTLDVAQWREQSVGQSGPMAVWDIVAQQIEEFIEHHTSDD